MPKHVVLEPTLSYEKARCFERRRDYLNSKDFDLLIEDHTLGTVDGEIKFLFLKNVFDSPDGRQSAYDTLRKLHFNPAKLSKRPALRGSDGGELMMGWFQDPINNGGRPRRLVATDHPDHFPAYNHVINQMFSLMADTIRKHLPEVWAEQLSRAKLNGRRLVGHIWTKDDVKGIQQDTVDGPRPLPTTTDEDWPLFSTATINYNTTCKSHTDAKNARGLSCLTAFGNYSGGALCFPRLRVAVNLKPGDLLISDTNREQHGNLEKTGNRISVVAYLRHLKGPKIGPTLR